MICSFFYEIPLPRALCLVSAMLEIEDVAGGYNKILLREGQNRVKLLPSLLW